MSRGSSFLRALLEALLGALSQGQKSQNKGSRSTPASPGARPGKRTGTAVWRDQNPAQHVDPDAGASPGQTGRSATRDLTTAELRTLRPSYAPQLDGEPDPGEVIWTWVPYAEHDGRGKDRPVLILARLDQQSWAGCYLSTKQHAGFVSVGTGAWDSQGRESFLSPERVLRVTRSGMRRESAGMDRATFQRAVQAVLRWHHLG